MDELRDICVDLCESIDCAGCKYEYATKEERHKAMVDFDIKNKPSDCKWFDFSEAQKDGHGCTLFSNRRRCHHNDPDACCYFHKQDGHMWRNIDISEPPDEKKVLLSVGDPSSFHPICFTSVGYKLDDRYVVNGEIRTDVVAWQWLPDPYEGEEHAEG